MEELIALLNNIEDSYYDFVSAMVKYAEKKTSRLRCMLDFLHENPSAKSSDVVKFVSDQSDFMEDAAFMKVS